MGFFCDDKSAQISALQQEKDELGARAKKIYAALIEARSRIEQLEGALAVANAEVASAKRLVAKARERQKASVERANRFKSRLNNLACQESV
ncbi:hypothetical protein LMG19087_00245 [Ralstonia wenshanensis]|uniref:hypothetical protein n=1 Tax=Ralstonia wenshanensis TaxID=2842456 RepID=UPI0028F6A68C|nr:hypothetical protein [Ralstonia wenshanensis]CAJ0808530.1 hypothetical protein LMG19087_00245 [Ralstonia wenshanensis]